MEHRPHSDLRKLILIVHVLALAASQVSGIEESVKATIKSEGLRLDMTHVDSLMDTEILHSPERLRRAAERSIYKAKVFARRVELAYSQTISQAPVVVADLAPVYSSATGAYLVDLAIGTPPQSFNGILDTGSDLVWRQSSPCVECFKQKDPLFEPSQSSTYKTVSCDDAFCKAFPEPLCGDTNATCNYYYTYGDGSTTMGLVSSDTLAIGGSSEAAFVFGAGNDNYGQIGNVGTDGIVGMGGGPLSLVSQMSSTIESKFAYCLVTWTDAPSKTSPLLLGSSATLTGPNVLSTPFVSNPVIPTFYYLDLKGISFNGELLSIPPGTFDLQPDGSGGIIIDSGTTITALVDAAFSPIKNAYTSAINLPPVDGSSVGLDLCYNNSNNATVDIPPLTLHFDGADVELPPENTFLHFQGYFCLAFTGIPPGAVNIYGNIQQQNFQILFDKGSANQLSFKPGVVCETL